MMDLAHHELGDYVWGIILSILVMWPMSWYVRRRTGKTIAELPLFRRMYLVFLMMTVGLLIMLLVVRLADLIRAAQSGLKFPG